MYSKWTSHIKDDTEKQNFRLEVLSSKRVLERLKQVLDEENSTLDHSEVDVRQFDQPNWEYRQAFKNGYRSALSIQKKLIDLDQQETDIV